MFRLRRDSLRPLGIRRRLYPLYEFPGFLHDKGIDSEPGPEYPSSRSSTDLCDPLIAEVEIAFIPPVQKDDINSVLLRMHDVEGLFEPAQVVIDGDQHDDFRSRFKGLRELERIATLLPSGRYVYIRDKTGSVADRVARLDVRKPVNRS